MTDKNRGNVAGGLKATLKNPKVSEEAKQNAQERLDAMDSGAATSEVQSGASQGTNNVLGGYKATLKNPNVSDEAKQHAKDILEDQEAI